METEGATETPQLIVGKSEVWVTWGPHLRLVSKVRAVLEDAALNLWSLVLTPGS